MLNCFRKFMGQQCIMHFCFLLYCSWITLFLYDVYYKLHIIMYYLRYILHLIVYNFSEPSHDLDEIRCTIYYDKNIMYLLYSIFSMEIFKRCLYYGDAWVTCIPILITFYRLLLINHKSKNIWKLHSHVQWTLAR